MEEHYVFFDYKATEQRALTERPDAARKMYSF